LDKVISGINNPWYRRGAQVAVGGVKEATDFVTSETIFSNITKPSEEVDYFDTSKFGFSLGVGNVVSATEEMAGKKAGTYITEDATTIIFWDGENARTQSI
jgi:hypothetical protein